MKSSPPPPGYTPAVSSYGIPESDVRNGREDGYALPVAPGFLTPIRSFSQSANSQNHTTSSDRLSLGATASRHTGTTMMPSDTYLIAGVGQDQSAVSTTQEDIEQEIPAATSVLWSSTTTRRVRGRPSTNHNILRPTTPSTMSSSGAPLPPTRPPTATGSKAVGGRKRKNDAKQQDPPGEQDQRGDARTEQEETEEDIVEVSLSQKRAKLERVDSNVPPITDLPGGSLQHGMTTANQPTTLSPQQQQQPTSTYVPYVPYAEALERLRRAGVIRPRAHHSTSTHPPQQHQQRPSAPPSQPPATTAPIAQAYYHQPPQPSASAAPFAQAHYPPQPPQPLASTASAQANLARQHAQRYYLFRQNATEAQLIAEAQLPDNERMSLQGNRRAQHAHVYLQAQYRQQRAASADIGFALAGTPLVDALAVLGQELPVRNPLQRLGELLIAASALHEGINEPDEHDIHDPTSGNGGT